MRGLRSSPSGWAGALSVLAALAVVPVAAAQSLSPAAPSATEADGAGAGARVSRWRPHRVGLHYGRAAQSRFPFDNPNYAYETHSVKAQLAWVLRDRRRLDLELLVEPSAYAAEHRLLRWGFIQPWDTPRYEEERARFLAGRRFVEYALNVGIVARVRLGSGLSTYGLLSVGPMSTGRHTERLRRGFAFSDVAALGLSYRRGAWQADARAVLRHNSNANLAAPNNGHNSAGYELGLGRWLTR